jgi:hypothetical protein
MVSLLSDQSHLNKKLNRLAHIYNLPTILNEDVIVANSSTNLDAYKSLILPAHVINNNNNTNINLTPLGVENYDINHEESNPDLLNLNNIENINTDSNFSSKNSNRTVIIGHCIIRNGGIPINNLSKIPSYQWGFKHEDDTLQPQNNLNNNLTNNISNNLSNNTEIPSGLGPLQGSSISTIAGNLTTANSTGLNSRMIRLPIKNANSSNVNIYDLNNCMNLKNNIKQGGDARSLMNGLPYYYHHKVEQQIRNLNLTKKLNFKASNTNTSWFSESTNETIDDVEYLHGEVILNQFVNNKRVIRNYGWLLYWDKNINHINLIDNQNENEINLNSNFMTFRKFKELINLRKKKFNELQTEKTMLKQQLANLNLLKEQKRNQYRLNNGNLPANIDDIVNDQRPPLAYEIYGSDLIKDEDNLIKRLKALPEYEEELELIEEPLHDNKNESGVNIENLENFESNSNIVQTIRFSSNPEYNETQEIVIEKELPINDPLLINYQNALYGAQKSQKLQLDARNKNGIIKSKIVKLKRTPNPNSLGFSNIRSRKPSFL